MHSHDHDHAGHHHHPEVQDGTQGAFIAGIVLNTIFVVIQVVAGIAVHSVALLSDAGHNLGDVASLFLSLLAFRLARSKPTHSFTYGYRKTTILASLANAVLLYITIGILGFESVKRFFYPQPVEGGVVALVAGIGVIVNFGSALFFMRGRKNDLNTRSAYLHLLTDALVSLGVVVAGILIRYTGWYWLDGAISLIVLVVIFIGTWSLLSGSLRLSLDAVPADVDKHAVEKVMRRVPGVESVHHMHIWAMSTTENALTCHVILDKKMPFDEKMQTVHKIKHELLHNNIHHATIELEAADMPCHEDECDH